MKVVALAMFTLCTFSSSIAQSLNGVCKVSVSEWMGDSPSAKLMFSDGGCSPNTRECLDMSSISLAWRRWTGISPQALQASGTHLTARLTGDAGELICDGVVNDATLSGNYRFTPNSTFLQVMTSLRFDGVTPREQLNMLFVDVTSAWSRDLGRLGVLDLTTNRLMMLRALHIDSAYIKAMAAAGYPELHAGRLEEMKAVGVTPETAAEAEAMGFHPTEQQLMEMATFKIDRPFVKRMRARGLQNLTLAKLLQIKLFKLDD